FHHVRIEGALDEEVDGVTLRPGLRDGLPGGGLEGTDELSTDDLPLVLRLDHAGEGIDEAFRRVDHLQADARRCNEVTLDLVRLALAQQAVVNEDAGELAPEGTVNGG